MSDNQHQATDKRPGFFMIENAVIDNFDFAPHTGWLYCCIVRHVNRQTGAAFPSIATLANKSGMSRTAVMKHMGLLEAAGLIHVKRQKRADGGNAPNHYYLLSANGVGNEVDQGSQPSEPGVGNEVDHNKTKVNKTKDSRPTPESENPTPEPNPPDQGGQSLESGCDMLCFDCEEIVCSIMLSPLPPCPDDGRNCNPACSKQPFDTCTFRLQGSPSVHDTAPSWWDDGHTMVMVQALHGRAPLHNRNISGWDDWVSNLIMQGYLVPGPTRANPSITATEKGKALATYPDIAKALAKLNAPPKPTKRKGKTPARGKRNAGNGLLSAEHEPLVTAIMVEWLKRPVADFHDLMPATQSRLRGVAKQLRAGGHTPDDVIWYYREFLPRQDWGREASYNCMVEGKRNMDVAKAERTNGSGLFLGVTSSTEELPPMDAGAGISTIGDDNGT